jgi:AcrR family transcriptional regulator
MVDIMPRVSEEHLAARRQQILDAAQLLFTRNGFHATSMHDVIAGAGLSVGAVYRYFKSKEDLIAAIAGETAGIVAEELEALALYEPPLPLSEALDRLLDSFEPRVGPDGIGRLALQVWSESLRNPRLSEVVHDVYRSVRGQFIVLAEGARRAGELPPDADPVAVGTVLFSMMLGYLVQRVVTGTPDRDTFLVGARTLLGRTTNPEIGLNLQ